MKKVFIVINASFNQVDEKIFSNLDDAKIYANILKNHLTKRELNYHTIEISEITENDLDDLEDWTSYHSLNLIEKVCPILIS